MRYALVDGKKTEPFPGGRGLCRGCDAEAFAKCGEFKMHHWAHKSRGLCVAADKEETPWHRQWKERYPVDWQEWPSTNPDLGERHFADVRTDKGLVLEFQNSPIEPEERRSREAHYKNMLWIVNGTKRSHDYPRFLKHLKKSHPTAGDRWHFIVWRDQAFPEPWLDSSVPVLFDFLGQDPLESAEDERQALWCLFPGRVEKQYGLVAKIYRHEFHKLTTDREHPFRKPTAEVMAEKAAGFAKNYEDWLDYL